MSEMKYVTNKNRYIQFSNNDNSEFGCLCTFLFNYQHLKKLNKHDIANLALLGAAVAIEANTHEGLGNTHLGNSDEFSIPDEMPIWIVDEIKRVLGIYK
jgi:hypothetical protein